MEALVKSVAEFFAAILGLLGFVGKTRRRAGIRDDLRLVDELAEHADFGRGSWPHQALMNHVALDVARLAGVPLRQRKTPWSSLVLALVIGVPLTYVTFKLNQGGFRWYSLFPGIVAGLMAMSILGALLPSDDPEPEEIGDVVVRPLAGDINAAMVIRTSRPGEPLRQNEADTPTPAGTDG